MYLADLEDAIDVFGPRVAQIYGQGETPMTITALPKSDHADRDHPRWRERLQSVGFARTDVEVRVVDDDDNELLTGEIGEVVVRGDVVMTGYWEQPGATAETLRGGWLHTGDVGSFDADGYLTLRDRSKDLIISGGMNIYPPRGGRSPAATFRRGRRRRRRSTGRRMGRVRGRLRRDRVRDAVADDRGARPDLPRSHRPLQATEGLSVRRCAPHQQLRQGGQAGVARAASVGAAAVLRASPGPSALADPSGRDRGWAGRDREG